jgi:hypothetical protein
VPAVGFPGDIVLGPFNGSGTTTSVAMRLGRRYIGIDGSPDYHRMAVARMRSGGVPIDPSNIRSGRLDKRLYNPLRQDGQTWLADVEEGA